MKTKREKMRRRKKEEEENEKVSKLAWTSQPKEEEGKKILEGEARMKREVIGWKDGKKG